MSFDIFSNFFLSVLVCAFAGDGKMRGGWDRQSDKRLRPRQAMAMLRVRDNRLLSYERGIITLRLMQRRW